MGRKLEVEVVGDDRSLQRVFGRSAKAADGFGKSFAKLGTAAVVAGAAVTAGFVVTLKRGFAELADTQKVTAQTAAVLKSTGNAAKTTGAEIERLAGELSRMSGVDDELIQSSENLLATFTQIRNEAGAGNDVFNQATAATLDLSVAMGKDLSSSAILVGKALNDPVKGSTALTRAGIQLTDQQKKSIASFVKQGKTMEAQKIILGELTTQFGGSAKAFGTTLPGQLAKLRNAFDEVAGRLAAKLLPGITRFLGFLNDALPTIERFAGKITGVLGDALSGIGDTLGETFDKFREAEGLRAKIDVVWTGLDEIAQKLATAIGEKLGGVDWAAAGTAIVDGIGAAIERTATLAKRFADLFARSVREVDWEQVGRIAGPGLAAAVATAFVTLTDPSFWIRNWDLALAIALVALSGSIGRLASKLVAPIARFASRFAGDLALSVAAAVERVFGTAVAGAVLRALQKLPGLVGAPFRALESLIEGTFARIGRLATFTVKVTGVLVVIREIGKLASAVPDLLRSMLDKVTPIALKVVGAILEPFTHLPFGLGEPFQKAQRVINEKLAAIEASAAAGGSRIGHSMMTSIGSAVQSRVGTLAAQFGAAVRQIIDKGDAQVGSTAGEYAGRIVGKGMADEIRRQFILNSETLPSTMAETVRNAIERARDAINAQKERFASALEALADRGFQAFDARSQKMIAQIEKRFDDLVSKLQAKGDALTPAERALDRARDDIAREGRESELASARGDLAAANAASDVAAVTAAQERIVAAEREIGLAWLEEQAETERTARDKRTAAKIAHAEKDRARTVLESQSARAEQRQALEGQLALLREFLSKHPGEWRKTLVVLGKMFDNEWGPRFYKAGNALGQAFAEGILNSIEKIEKAGAKLAQTLRDYLPSSPAKVGPLSDLDKVGPALVATIARGIDPRPIERALEMMRLPQFQIGGAQRFSPTGGLTPALAGTAASGSFLPQVVESHITIELDGQQLWQGMKRQSVRDARGNAGSSGVR